MKITKIITHVLAILLIVNGMITLDTPQIILGLMLVISADITDIKLEQKRADAMLSLLTTEKVNLLVKHHVNEQEQSNERQ